MTSKRENKIIIMVIPLYGRAYCSKKYPQVFSEPEAERIVDMVDYDFSALNYKEFMMMTWAVRKKLLCDKMMRKSFFCLGLKILKRSILSQSFLRT